ncbi:MAG: GNAT family N-acetyltransferase [Ignavibacteria bacterium]|nr:GNAT family N-acetyltransferase [Ignavibacteria bacterium]
MKKIITLSDKKVIESFFRKNTCLNIYPIGDLDEFFFKHTKWYALTEKTGENKILEIAFLYTGTDLPVLLAVCDGDLKNMKELLKEISAELPDKIYAHLSPGLEIIFSNEYKAEDFGRHYKMCLVKNNFQEMSERDNIRSLMSEDIEEIQKFYADAYPGNWFDMRMLETGKYFGYYSDGKLTGAAGIHVYSPEFKVAALGNITTHPFHRGKSICRKLTSVLCSDLFETTDHIGLNVHIDNKAAIECYIKTGFNITGEYHEYLFEKK